MKRIVLTLVTCLVFFAAFAQEPACIPTQWAFQMNPAAPLPEYPRPQMVRASWQNLNGEWDYAILDKDADYTSPDGKIVVPFAVESALSGVQKKVGPDKALWYSRTKEKDPTRLVNEASGGPELGLCRSLQDTGGITESLFYLCRASEDVYCYGLCRGRLYSDYGRRS